MVLSDPHHNLELLRAYGVGKVGGAAADKIAEHLETCAECRQVVAAAPADRFLSDLQNLISPADRFEGVMPSRAG